MSDNPMLDIFRAGNAATSASLQGIRDNINAIHDRRLKRLALEQETAESAARLAIQSANYESQIESRANRDEVLMDATNIKLERDRVEQETEALKTKHSLLDSNIQDAEMARALEELKGGDTSKYDARINSLKSEKAATEQRLLDTLSGTIQQQPQQIAAPNNQTVIEYPRMTKPALGFEGYEENAFETSGASTQKQAEQVFPTEKSDTLYEVGTLKLNAQSVLNEDRRTTVFGGRSDPYEGYYGYKNWRGVEINPSDVYTSLSYEELKNMGVPFSGDSPVFSSDKEKEFIEKNYVRRVELQDGTVVDMPIRDVGPKEKIPAVDFSPGAIEVLGRSIIEDDNGNAVGLDSDAPVKSQVIYVGDQQASGEQLVTSGDTYLNTTRSLFPESTIAQTRRDFYGGQEPPVSSDQGQEYIDYRSLYGAGASEQTSNKELNFVGPAENDAVPEYNFAAPVDEDPATTAIVAQPVDTSSPNGEIVQAGSQRLIINDGTMPRRATSGGLIINDGAPEASPVASPEVPEKLEAKSPVIDATKLRSIWSSANRISDTKRKAIFLDQVRDLVRQQKPDVFDEEFRARAKSVIDANGSRTDFENSIPEEMSVLIGNDRGVQIFNEMESQHRAELTKKNRLKELDENYESYRNRIFGLQQDLLKAKADPDNVNKSLVDLTQRELEYVTGLMEATGRERLSLMPKLPEDAPANQEVAAPAPKPSDAIATRLLDQAASKPVERKPLDFGGYVSDELSDLGIQKEFIKPEHLPDVKAPGFFKKLAEGMGFSSELNSKINNLTLGYVATEKQKIVSNKDSAGKIISAARSFLDPENGELNDFVKFLHEIDYKVPVPVGMESGRIVMHSIPIESPAMTSDVMSGDQYRQEYLNTVLSALEKSPEEMAALVKTFMNKGLRENIKSRLITAADKYRSAKKQEAMAILGGNLPQDVE